MRTISLLQPQKIVFGPACAGGLVADLEALGFHRVFLVTNPPVLPHAEPLVASLKEAGLEVLVFSQVTAEPDLEMLAQALEHVRRQQPQAVVGIGGGSALDLAKLLAAMRDIDGDVRDFFGTNRLPSRHTYLACLPTTSGTGSEVSTNAILLDREDRLKKGVVSPHLVPDAAYVDPALTRTVPPAVTASTGADALTHCVEEYANLFAHPAMDVHAIKGIEMVGRYLARAVANGEDMEAREGMALASLFGGLGLGPVGTGAVHALAYPLGGEFHVAHGLSNAVLLPYVMEFNIPAMPERYADVALALGAKPGSTAIETAQRGLERLRELYYRCGLETGLRDMGVPEGAIPGMAEAAMKVTRLLKNNPRPLTAADAEAIYRAAY